MKPIKGTKNRIIFKEVETEEKPKLYAGAEKYVDRGIIVEVTEKDEDGNAPKVKKGDVVLLTKSAFMEKFIVGEETFYQTLEASVVVIL